MTPATGTARKVLTSGWVPFALVVLGFAVLVHRAAGVGYGDVVLFGGYLAGWIVLPGTVVWRLVDPRKERRHLGEDLAIGALAGYVLEFPVYIACLALGHPHGYVLWPVVPVVFLLTPAARRLRHLGSGRLPLAWSWSVAAAGVYLVVWFGHYWWGPSPTSTESLSRPYIDEPFHLSLASSLRHFFPTRISYVDDTPLDYHWLSHLHIAASSWVTGVEPIVLLRALAIPALAIIVVVAGAFIAVRLTGARWAGMALLATLAVAPASFSAWNDGSGEPFLSSRLLLSPSAGFVNAALLLGIFLTVELLRRTDRTWAAIGLAFLSYVAMSGAKSTSLPTLLAGLAAATLVSSVLARKIDFRAAMLTVAAGAAFLISRPIFFGSGSHGLALDPLGFSTTQLRRFPGLGDSSGDMAFDTRAVVALSMLGFLSLGAGVLALLSRGGWRRPDHVFLMVTCAAGIGAGLAFHQSSFSEYYFIYVVALPFMLAATLGLHQSLGSMPGRAALKLGVVALVVGALGRLAFLHLTDRTLPQSITGSPMKQAIQLFAVPELTAVAVTLTLAAAVYLVQRRRAPGGFGVFTMIAVVVFAGFGTGAFVRDTVPDILKDPVPTAPVAHRRPLVPAGGIAVARWLRAHSGVDDLVATNAHCQFPDQQPCVPRNFWMAGYSERQFLVEGWSYISRWSIGEHPPSDENVTVGPFWDPQRLADNDAAFLQPSPATLDLLKTKYGVKWLLVDRRFPVDLSALREYAKPRFHDGRCLVLELR
jgi:hypothetical protein